MAENDIMTPLSPATQAVIDAFTEDNSLHDWKVHIHHLDALAAALRAAAEEVVLPKYQYADWQMAHLIMQEIQDIADELEDNA